MTRSRPARHPRGARAALVTACAVLAALLPTATGTPVAYAGSGPLTVTLSAPAGATLTVPFAVAGTVQLATTGVGVPNQSVQLLVDGAVASTVTTSDQGAYSGALALAAYGPHTLQAVVLSGTPVVESRSDPQSVQASPAPATANQVSDMFTDTAFLYSGPAAVQHDVTPGTILSARVNVLRGQVLDRQQQPLAGVGVSIEGHSEFGSTSTRPDGWFDLVVNGGGTLTVGFTKTGFLPVHRTVNPGWRDYTVLPEVALTPLDGTVSTLTSGASSMQVARGSVSLDDDGSRQATLLMPANTHAVMTLPNGSTQQLSSLQVRATEYTVGSDGPAAMPAPLPGTSAYTYAVDYTVDEAVSADATTVSFDKPLAAYTDNFLNVPVGERVPAGFYDPARTAWVGEPDGRVIKIVSVTAGKADVDVTGDGTADTGSTLAELGISDAERTTLAGLYPTGKSLWRVRISHFSPHDYNWPHGPPTGAVGPDGKPITDGEQSCEKSGSIIGCENQTLGERVPVVGTPYALHYSSSRMPGYAANGQMRVPLTSATPPAPLAGVTLDIDIAGQHLHREFAPAAGQEFTFGWDGRDGFGRLLRGSATAHVRVGYEYQGVYYGSWGAAGASFAMAGQAKVGFSPTRDVYTFATTSPVRLGGLPTQALADLGGWTLDVHHAYDPDARTIRFGDGTDQTAGTIGAALVTAAGTGAAGVNQQGTYSGDNGPAMAAGLGIVQGMTTGPDGTVYLADSNNGVIRAIGPDGVIRRVAGGGTPASGNGDGGPATSAELLYPTDVALGPDGSLYLVETGANLIRKITPDGVISTFAGGGTPTDGLGDQLPATEAALSNPRAVSVRPDGRVDIADTGHQRIRQIGPDGLISTVAGGGSPADGLGDGLPGPQGKLLTPLDLALAADGSLAIADSDHNRVRLLRPDGSLITIAGNGDGGIIGNGGPATNATVGTPTGVAFDPSSGMLLIAQQPDAVVRAVDAAGIITTVIGTGTPGFAGDNGPPAAARLTEPHAVAVSPTGAVYLADAGNFRIRSWTTAMPGVSLSDLLVPSPDGALLYQFSSTGQHERTRDALTGLTLLTFGYDSDRLVTITDQFDNTTRIVRDPQGRPTSIEAPYGQVTTLHHNSDGYLDEITDPATQHVQLGYGTGGLLTSFTDPRNNTTVFEYDPVGRLRKDTSPDGKITTLTRTETPTGHVVVADTAEGRSTSYRSETLPDGTGRTTITNPDGTRMVMTTNPNGTVRVQDPDGDLTVATRSPDPRWGMLAPYLSSSTVTTPGGRAVTMTSNRTVTLTVPGDPLSLSSQTNTVTSNNRTATATYTAATRTETRTSAAGRQTTTVYTSTGLVASFQGPGYHPVSYQYDPRGRLEQTTTGTGPQTRTTLYRYGSDGLVSEVQDPLHTTVYRRDAAGRVLEVEQPDSTITAFGYDANSNLTSLTPPGRTAHTFGHTKGDQTERYTTPALPGVSRDTTTAYNRDREPTLTTLPTGRTLTSEYDATRGRATRTLIGAGAFSYRYHATSGLPIGVTTPAGDTLDSTLDGALPLTVTAAGVAPGTVSYDYDTDLRVKSRKINTGPLTSFGYNNDGQLTSVGPAGNQLTLSYHATSGYQSGSTIGTISTSLHRDGFTEPDTSAASTTAGGGSTLYSASYTRDLLGRLATVTETIGGIPHTYGYTYDTLDRLKTISVDGNAYASYDYDANGNRIGSTVGGSPTTAEVDGQDRLSRHGTTNYTYNDDGQLDTAITATAVTDYDYNELGQLTHVLLPDGTALDYRYDGEGRRISKSVNGTITQRLLYGQGRSPIAELDATGAVTSTFTYASNPVLPDLITQGGVTYRVISDHQNNPRLVVNSTTGAIAQRLDFDAWGTITQDTNPGFQPFGYTGALQDSHTGLVHVDARDYDPRTGRFTSKDPIGFAGGHTNLYSYVGNDPINLADPSGLLGIPFVDMSVDDAAQAFMGAADSLTLGGTEWVRNKAGLGHTVDYCSGWRKAGGIAADLNPKGAIKHLGRAGLKRLAKREGDDAGRGVVKTTCNCFPAGTSVATAGGPRKIEDIKIGDQVWAHDLATGASELRTVEGLFHKKASALLTLTVDGTVIQVTPDHPFYVPGRGWVSSGTLKVGDQLLRRDGTIASISSITRRAAAVTVYNFAVDGDHNYYISAAEFLVHNCPVPKSPQNFLPPTNPPSLPPTNAPAGFTVRQMGPTPDYPRGYWRMTNAQGQYVDPSTLKPPGNVTRAMSRAMTHVEMP